MAVKLLSKYNTITEALGFNLTAEQAKKFGFNPLKRKQDIIETVTAMYNYDTTTSTLSEYSSNTAVKAYTYYDTTKSYFFREFDDLKHEGLFQAITNPYRTDSTTQIPACTCSGRKITGTGTNQPDSSFFVYKNNSIVSLGIYWEQLKYNTQKWIGDYGKTEPYVGGTYDVRTTSHTHAFVDQRTEILKTVTDANSVITGFKDFKWLTKNKRIFLWSNVTDGSLAKAGEWIPHYSLFFIAQTEEIRTRLKAKLDVLKENCTKTVDEYDTLIMEITGATSKTQNLFYNGVLLAYRGPGSIIYIFPPTTGIHSAFCPDDGLTAYPLTEHGYIDYDSIIYGVQYTRALGAAGVNPNILDKIEGCYYIDCLAYNEKEKPSIPTTVTIDQYDYSENDNLGVLTITLGQDVDEEGIVYEHRLFREPWYATAPKAPLTFSNRQESTIEIEYTNSQGVSTTITRPVITYNVSFSGVGYDQTAVVMVDVEVPIHGGYDNYSFQLNFITINAIITIEPSEVTCTPSTIPHIVATLTYQHWTTFTSEQLAGLSQKNSDGTFNVSAIMAYIIANIMTVTPPEIENTYQIIEYYNGLNLSETKNRRGETVHCLQLGILGVSDPTYADTNTTLKGKHVWTYTAVGRPSEVCPYASADFTVNIETIYATGGTDFITGELSPNTGQWDGSGEYDEDFDYSTTCPSGNFFFYDSRGVNVDLTLLCVIDPDVDLDIYFKNDKTDKYFKKDIDGVYYYMDVDSGCFLFAEPITQGQAAHTVQIKITVMPITLYLSKNKGYAIYKQNLSQSFNIDIPYRFNEAYNLLVNQTVNTGSFPYLLYGNCQYQMGPLKKLFYYKINKDISEYLQCASIDLSFKAEATLAIDISKIDENIFPELSYFDSLGENIIEQGNKLYTPLIATAGSYDNTYIKGCLYTYEKEINKYCRTNDFEGSSIFILSRSILGFFGAGFSTFDDSKWFSKLTYYNKETYKYEYRHNIDDIYLNLYARGVKVFQTKSGKKILAFTTNREYENLYGYSFDHFKQNGVIKNRLRIAYNTFSGGTDLEYYRNMASSRGGMLYDWKTHELIFLIAVFVFANQVYYAPKEMFERMTSLPSRKTSYHGYFANFYYINGLYSLVLTSNSSTTIYMDNTLVQLSSGGNARCTFTDIGYEQQLPTYSSYGHDGKMLRRIIDQSCINMSFPFVSYTADKYQYNPDDYYDTLNNTDNFDYVTSEIVADNKENTALLVPLGTSYIWFIRNDSSRIKYDDANNIVTGLYLRDRKVIEDFKAASFDIGKLGKNATVALNYHIFTVELTNSPEIYLDGNLNICIKNLGSSISIKETEDGSYSSSYPWISIYCTFENNFVNFKISITFKVDYKVDYDDNNRSVVKINSIPAVSIRNICSSPFEFSTFYSYIDIFATEFNPQLNPVNQTNNADSDARFITFDDISQ